MAIAYSLFGTCTSKHTISEATVMEEEKYGWDSRLILMDLYIVEPTENESDFPNRTSVSVLFVNVVTPSVKAIGEFFYWLKSCWQSCVVNAADVISRQHWFLIFILI